MITSAQISDLFAEEGILQELSYDSTYSLVDDAFIDTFSTSFFNLIRVLDLSEYMKDSNDCEDFAFLAWSYAKVCHGRKRTGTGLGMGVVLYKPDWSPINHGINLWLVKYDSKYKLHFWEPQKMRKVILSQDEKDSIFNVIM